MVNEPVIAPVQTEMPIVETVDHSATQPAPSPEQQRTADDVFTREQGEVASAILAAQVGLGLLHTIAAETFRRPAEEPLPRKKQPEDGGQGAQ